MCSRGVSSRHPGAGAPTQGLRRAARVVRQESCGTLLRSTLGVRFWSARTREVEEDKCWLRELEPPDEVAYAVLIAQKEGAL